MFVFIELKTKFAIETETKLEMKKELLTEKQEARRDRDQEVITAYKRTSAKYPTASKTKVINELARQGVGGLRSYYGVRRVLVNHGL